MFFSSINICQGSYLNMRLIGRVFKYLLRVPASVNAMTGIFAYLTYPIRTENAAEALKYPFSYTGFL